MDPLIIDETIAKKNPKFKKLVDQLNENYQKKALLDEQQLQQARERLQKSKVKYLKNKFMYDTIEEILTLDKITISEEDVWTLKTIIARSEIPHYLNSPALSTLLDLMKLYKKDKPSFDLALFIENKIKERKQSLIEFYTKREDLKTLAYQIKSDVEKIKEKKMEIEEQKSKRKTVIEDYTEVMESGISKLKDFINLYNEKLKTDIVDSDLYASKCRTMHHKMLSLEQSLLRETYPSDVITAHGIIRDREERRKQELVNKCKKLTTSIEDYQNMGPEYENIVEEYTALTNTLENKEWVFTQMAESMK